MSKYPSTQLDQILKTITDKRCFKLTATEMTVFINWLSNSFHFNASPRTIANRTGIDYRNVRRALDGLVKKKVLEVSGLKNRIKSYHLSEKIKSLSRIEGGL